MPRRTSPWLSPKAWGAEVEIHTCSQAEALNRLLAVSDARYTLLLHSDVVLLSDEWFARCVSRIGAGCALVSPEDVGCGPYTRPFGAGKPESSFMFFDSQAARRCRYWQWRRWRRVPYAKKIFDFYGNHITHRIPERLRAQGYTWHAMRVHPSDRVTEPIYVPKFQPGVWSDELPYLRYGLGNFYSLDGVITHYHNWYERADLQVDIQSTRTTSKDNKGFPLAYISVYTQAFLNDYSAGSVTLPSLEPYEPRPRAL